MGNTASVNSSRQISPYMVMFVIHPIQIGIGVLSFQHDIVEKAGYDAWISILLAGLGIHLLIWLIYGLLNRAGGDLIHIHQETFGKWVGGLFSLIFILYFTTLSTAALRTYAMVVQVWMFPTLATWVICVLMLFLTYYAINGGFRVVVGVCFFGFFIPIIGVTWAFAFPFEYMHFRNLLPILNHSFSDIMLSTKLMTLSYLGFCSLLMAYPFIDKPRASQKWAHIGNGFTILVYFFIGILSFGYYSPGLLMKTIWPTLTMMKIVQIPFLERFEHIFIPIWLLTMMPNVVLTLWVASRGAKRLFNIKQRNTLRILIVMVFVAAAFFFPDRRSVTMLNKSYADFAFYFLYAYLPILWLVQFVRYKVRKPS
ncbi:MAG TPA: GerAB/ArcD/ProY family transporter [Bacillales bacterium]|nr:GerAB/ArcD/ProY family transporter [Bacillales bacterium]